MNQQKGFGLLEVMISIAIFSFISIATYSVISSTINRKNRIDEYEEINHSIRVMFNTMRRDFELAYNYVPLSKKLGTNTPPQGGGGGAPDGTPNLPNAAEQNEENNMVHKPYKTVFLGKDTEVHFTSLGHRKLGINSKESDQCEISYYLFKDEERDYNNLVRRESGFIDDQPFKGGETNELVEAVKSVKFRYYASDTNNWIEYWDSEDPSPTMKNKFPEAIEVTIDIDTSINEATSNLKLTTIYTLDSSTWLQKPIEEKKGPPT